MTAGGKLFLAGLAISVAGAALLAASGARTLAEVQRSPTVAEPLGIGLLIAAVGACVYVLQPAFDRELAARLPVASLPTVLAMLAVVNIVGSLAALPVIAITGPRGQLGPVELTAGIAASELPLLGVVWLRLVVPGCRTWQQLGLRRKALGETVSNGIAGGFGLFILAGIVGVLLSRLGVTQTQADRFAGIEHAPLPLFALALFAGCVLAPFVEETFFRGYVFQAFSDRWGAPAGYVISASLFAFAHLNLQAAAPIFVLGLALAYIYNRTGSLFAGMIAHGVNNLISFSLLYFVGLKG